MQDGGQTQANQTIKKKFRGLWKPKFEKHSLSISNPNNWHAMYCYLYIQYNN